MNKEHIIEEKCWDLVDPNKIVEELEAEINDTEENLEDQYERRVVSNLVKVKYLTPVFEENPCNHWTKEGS